MDILGDTSQEPLSLNAADANAENLGFIVESSALTQALLKQIALLGVPVLFDAVCEKVVNSPAQVALKLSSEQGIESQLLLAADGSQSWVRQQLALPMKQKAYQQTAIVANFKVEKPHENIARQWFLLDEEGQSNILAWLPSVSYTHLDVYKRQVCERYVELRPMLRLLDSLSGQDQHPDANYKSLLKL